MKILNYSDLWFWGSFIVLAWIEHYLYLHWNKSYFIKGITIYKKQVPVDSEYKSLPGPLKFENQFPKKGVRSFQFLEIDSGRYAVREGFLSGQFMMRGMLTFDGANKKVLIKGYLSYSFLYFCFNVMIVEVFFNPILKITISGLFLLFCFLLLYVRDMKKFDQIVHFSAGAKHR